jgi:hypothetical protein
MNPLLVPIGTSVISELRNAVRVGNRTSDLVDGGGEPGVHGYNVISDIRVKGGKR